jgi:UDP-N-acetylmuramoylalanine--D-glutamate ligase
MNWQLDQFKNKDIVFVGAGKGRALQGLQSLLEKHTQLASFIAVDKRDGDNPLAFLTTYNPETTLFIKNEGIPGHTMPVPYTTVLQLFFSLIPQIGAITIGITGTKGKSTTAALTAHILMSAHKPVILAGNIGTSPLLSLDEATHETIFVLELSSYQLSDLTVSPHISTCINLYNDHTDWHGSLKDYWEAKHNIMRYAHSNDVFIFNPDFPELQKWSDAALCRSVAIEPSEQLSLSDAHLFGDHNRLNALIARQIARELGVADNVTQAAIDSFVPLEHRMQVVTTTNDLTFIDDAIGMTPESTIASLTAIHEKFGRIGCLLLGGQDRNYDYEKLLKTVATLAVPYLVLFPNTIHKMRAALPPGYNPEILEATNMDAAVAFAKAHAPKQSVVLLSTAAPSYSLWKDFEDKGTQFQKAAMAPE